MNLVSKKDIKAALSEKYEVVQKDIEGKDRVALVDATVGNTPYEKLVKFLVLCIDDYFTRLGHKLQEAGGSEFQIKTSKTIADDIKNTMKHLRINEVKLAIVYGAMGVFGEPKHCSPSNMEHYLMAYLQLPERAMAKEELAAEENQSNNVKLLSEKSTTWTEDDYINAMRSRYKENIQRVRDGKSVIDVGGLLFTHMYKLGIIEMTVDDEKEVVEQIRTKKKLNPLDVRYRELLRDYEKGSNSILPMIREHVMTKYFKMEVQMRDAANLIKKQENERENEI
jgi:hypothetical protein